MTTLTASNRMQKWTDDMADRAFFAIVASGAPMYDQTRQDPQHAQVRLHDGTFVYVRDLPVISASNPQPNGDYFLPLNKDHLDGIDAQVGSGWVFISPDDGMVHMMGVLSHGPAYDQIMPLIQDGTINFSTQGQLSGLTDDGVYKDFVVDAVAVCQIPNDAGSQVVSNNTTSLRKDSIVDESEKKAAVDAVKETFANATKVDPVKIAKAIMDLGIDPTTRYFSDIFTDVLNALSGVPYDQDMTEVMAETGKTVSSSDGAPDMESASDDDEAEEKTNAATDAEIKEQKMENHKRQIVSQGGSMDGPGTLPKQPATGEVHNSTFIKNRSLEQIVSSDRYGEWYCDKLAAYVNAKGSKSPEDFTHEIAEAVQNDSGLSFTPDEVSLVPEALITEIRDLLQTDASIFSRLTFTGTNVWKVSAHVSGASQAVGRKRGVLSEKKRQTLKITPRTFTIGQIYKMISIPSLNVDINGGLNGSIMSLIAQELAQRVVKTVEQAVLMGGVMNDDGSAFDSIIPIMADAEGTEAYATVYTPAAGEPAAISLLNATAGVLPVQGMRQNLVAIMSRKDFALLKAQAAGGTGTGFPINLMASRDQIASYIGVDDIITPPWMTDGFSDTEIDPNGAVAAYLQKYSAAIVDFSSFYAVGNTTPKSLSEYFLRANAYDSEAVLNVGGGLTTPHAAVLVKRPTTSGGTTRSAKHADADGTEAED